MGNWYASFEKLIGGGPGGKKRLTVVRMLIIVGAVGIFFMLIQSYLPFKRIETIEQLPQPELGSEEVFKGGASSDSPFASIEATLEDRLKEMLEKMVGVGKVDVMITVESTEEKVVERNVNSSESTTDETDRNGGKRHMTTVTSDGQVVLYQATDGQQPLITKVINPRIRGVLIVAEGAEDAAVRKLIIQAVEKGMNVVPTRISVVPSKKS
ncbi:stage III sporulation protein AG [Paenibacillus montaniterrae]|uniref:Stage III sporulation protein AG n=1 Tax=Paenibacillus montaniterrae TaxID=429341 RepID=A0A920CVT0_9BACL|nr:stage III sporulation protein AG [Paenibacillus montaniterrae]GIP15261.1 stage III sporulation protein AG [Paenibacillus montaniterrae]